MRKRIDSDPANVAARLRKEIREGCPAVIVVPKLKKKVKKVVKKKVIKKVKKVIEKKVIKKVEKKKGRR